MKTERVKLCGRMQLSNVGKEENQWKQREMDGKKWLGCWQLKKLKEMLTHAVFLRDISLDYLKQ